jgi:hypothetical protein
MTAPSGLLVSGRFVRCDQQDFDLFAGACWDGRYARNKQDRVHRLIATRLYGAIAKDKVVDHRDGDTRNNCRNNLRLVTRQQNATNAAARGGISKFRGVYLRKSGRWSAQIASRGTREHLGTFDKEELAAAAYNNAAVRIHGEFARLNTL